MTDTMLWALFCTEKNISDVPYQAWAFGGAPDTLVDLVLQGVKTGTASAYALYEAGAEPLPQEGDYSVILDGAGNAKCVIQTTKLYVVPFHAVTRAHAEKEGEGDRSLAYWQRVHEEFFTDCLREIGGTFDQAMPVLCEEFQLVYTP